MYVADEPGWWLVSIAEEAAAPAVQRKQEGLCGACNVGRADGLEEVRVGVRAAPCDGSGRGRLAQRSSCVI